MPYHPPTFVAELDEQTIAAKRPLRVFRLHSYSFGWTILHKKNDPDKSGPPFNQMNHNLMNRNSQQI
jgi:hypothetical protein